MWKDSETELDYLDYDYLIHALENIVTNDSFLPASVGVYGDWGSGKSSLMYMCKKQLEQSDENIKCLLFNGWLFENYEDAKTAIIGSILDEIRKEEKTSAKVKDIIKGLNKSIDKFKLMKEALKFGSDFLLTGGVGTIAEITTNRIVGQLQNDGETVNLQKIQSAVSDELNSEALRNDIREFQNKFTELLEESKISHLVVFIDELDRCRPDTILDTLEAIKLFLFKGKVAFVIGADERHISYAVKSKFKDIEGIQIDIGKEYLEKLIQYPIRIPRLNSDEVEIYIACLLMQNELKNEDFETVLKYIQKQKQQDFEQFKLKEVCEIFDGTQRSDNPRSTISEDIAIANQLSSVLASGLHGNPRQCKRFLNSMYMRLQMAEYKHKELDRKILAKIMMLEYIKPRLFNKLAEMAVNDTLNFELKQLEEGDIESIDELKIWAEDTWVNTWCKIPPKLADVNLNIYFYFMRTSLDEKISRISAVLSPEAKSVLDGLLSNSDSNIKKALKAAVEITDSEASAILEGMYSSMKTEISINKKMLSFLKFSELRPELLSDTLSNLQSIPGSQIALSCAAYIADFAKKGNKVTEIKEISSRWGSTKKELQTSIDKLLTDNKVR